MRGQLQGGGGRRRRRRRRRSAAQPARVHRHVHWPLLARELLAHSLSLFSLSPSSPFPAPPTLSAVSRRRSFPRVYSPYVALHSRPLTSQSNPHQVAQGTGPLLQRPRPSHVRLGGKIEINERSRSVPYRRIETLAFSSTLRDLSVPFCHHGSGLWS